LTQQYLSLIETGHQNITLKTMMALARVVGCNVSDMLRQPPKGRSPKCNNPRIFVEFVECF
jgi:DNA-binding Xre family transcriptional regulator